MNAVAHEVEEIDHPESSEGADDGYTERILHITITGKTAEEAAAEYNFTTQQLEMLQELLEEREMLADLIGSLMNITADAKDVLLNLPEDLSPEEAATSVRPVPWWGRSITSGAVKASSWVGTAAGTAHRGHSGREQHHRHLPALWPGLLRVRGTGCFTTQQVVSTSSAMVAVLWRSTATVPTFLGRRRRLVIWSFTGGYPCWDRLRLGRERQYSDPALCLQRQQCGHHRAGGVYLHRQASFLWRCIMELVALLAKQKNCTYISDLRFLPKSDRHSLNSKRLTFLPTQSGVDRGCMVCS